MRFTRSFLFVFAFFVFISILFGASWASIQAAVLPALKVSSDGHYLVKSDGTPFFYLADSATAMILEIPNPSDVDFYLQDRKNKNFTVIQTVAMWGVASTFASSSFSQPNTAYWSRVDYVVNKADELGLYVGLFPTWGSVVSSGQLTALNAQAYGEFLGARYKDRPIIWILGGDMATTTGYEPVWRALAKGIAIGASGTEDYSKTLMTYHPQGSSATWFHNDAWLDFNMITSSHTKDLPYSYSFTQTDYARIPPKPVVDGESTFENIASGLKMGNPKITDYDVRKSAYLSVFAGGFGYAYGANEVYMFWDPGETGWGAQIWGADTPWRDALNFPGATQMKHLRTLMESRTPFTRVPDQSLALVPGSGTTRVQATRSSDGKYAYIYIADGHAIDVPLTKITGAAATASWFNPRTGAVTVVGQFPTTQTQRFTPPSNGTGNDWVLVLDTAPGPTLPAANGYWKLDAGTGVAATDSSGKGNTGTLLGGPVWTTGLIAKALSFDGVNDFVSVTSNTTLSGLPQITVSGWVKLGSLPATYYTPFAKEGEYRVTVSPGGVVSFTVATINNAWYTPGTSATAVGKTLKVGTWSHITGTYDGSRVRIYIDGALLGTSPQNISGKLKTNQTALTIGNKIASNTAFTKGIIDDVRVYVKALTALEISKLYFTR